MTDLLLGIDLGSTSLKAVLYDLDGNPVAKGSRPTEKFHPDEDHPEWVVWQPEQIWGGTAAAVRDVVAGLDDPRKIRAVAVTGMGMDGLPIDEQGNWLYPMISCAEQFVELRALFDQAVAEPPDPRTCIDNDDRIILRPDLDAGGVPPVFEIFFP